MITVDRFVAPDLRRLCVASADVVSWGSSVASTSASPGQTATAKATAEVSSLSLFGGEVTASSIRG